MNAVAFLGFGNSATWKEEVLLHDGKTIVVERSRNHGGRGEIGQSPVKEHSMTFTLPGTNKAITWKDEYSHEIGHANFDLLALHVLNGTPYVVVSLYGCLSYNKWGRPNPPYVIFRYDGKEWQRIPLTELPQEFKEMNLVHSASSVEKKLVKMPVATPEMIKEFNNSLTQPEYRTIIRMPLETGKNSCSDVDCEEMIPNGRGGWAGFTVSSMHSYEECITVCNFHRLEKQFCPCDDLLKTKPEWR